MEPGDRLAVPVMGDDERDPWERQLREPPQAFHAFCHYRDLPPGRRSVAAAYRDHLQRCLGRQPRRVQVPARWAGWRAQYDWEARSTAWDDYRDMVRREADLRALEAMARRHAAIAMELQQKAVQRLRTLELWELSAEDVRRYLVDAVRLERMARGQPETVTAVDQRVSMQRVVDEFRRVKPAENPEAVLRLARELFAGDEETPGG